MPRGIGDETLTVGIVEVVERSNQGVTEPFICRGDDDKLYYVKGKSAGKSSLIKEWICGCLARQLDLPVADFEIVDIPLELIEPHSGLQLWDLGAGLAFGSRQREYAGDIRFSQLTQVPIALRQDIMVFDRWIRNYDRTLSQNGGNPNLLWASDTQSAVIIDHNNAFDEPVSGQDFADLHIFGKEFLVVRQSPDLISRYRERLDSAIAQWQTIVSALPPEWMFVDATASVPVNFNLNDAFEVLKEHQEQGFWSW